MIPWAFCLILLSADAADAANWPSFRNGGASRTLADHLPLHWSPDRGIAWQRELPGYGQSSPVVWGQTVLVTAVVGPMKETCLVLAVDTGTGKTRWTKEFSACTTKASNYMASRAAPTPVVDARGIYAFFEGGNFVALDHRGELRWSRSLTAEYGEFQNGHGLGSSLAQTEDAVFVLVDHEGPSYLLAVDKANGKNRWKTDRKPRYSWASPIVVRRNGREQVIVSSNGYVDGYDASGGQLLWSVDGVGGNSIPSPAVLGDRIFVGAARSEFGASKEAVSSCCLGFRRQDGKETCEVLWRSAKALSSYASPLPCGDCVYHVNSVGAVHCLDARTGTAHYVERLAGPCWATPVVAGQHVYFFSKNGVTTVLKTGPEFAKVATNPLWDPKSPPKPENYVEHTPPPSENPRNVFLDRWKENDKNGDGKVSKDEAPASLQGFFARIDANSNGILEPEEVAAYRERASRRNRGEGKGRQQVGGSHGDPTVYGVAASNGSFLVRTGTRLYCVQ